MLLITMNLQHSLILTSQENRQFSHQMWLKRLTIADLVENLPKNKGEMAFSSHVESAHDQHVSHAEALEL